MDGNLPNDLQKPILRNAAAPKDAIDLADEALGLPPRARNLPPPPENDASTLDVMGAAWDAETVKTDAWGPSDSLRRDLILDMWRALPTASKDKLDRERFDQNNSWRKLEAMVMDEVRTQAQIAPEAAMLFGKFPQSQEAFDARINDLRRAEWEEANAITNQPGGGVAEFIGAGARSITDPISLALIPFGGPVGGSVLKFAAVEAGLGVLGEAAILPREFQVAQDLGLPNPDVGTRLAFGGLAGGVLGGAIAGVPRVLSYAGARRTAAQQAAREGEDILDAEAAVDAAEAQMRGDTTIVEEIGMPKLPPKSPLEQALGQDNTAFGGVYFNFRAGGNAAAQTNPIGYVFGKLVELGYPPHVAAGLVGNLMQESGPGLNTRAVGDGGNAFGMGQWNGPRMRALNAFARKNGGNPASRDMQVQFLHHELQNSERGALDQIMRAPDAETAAAIASDMFWRPGIPHKANRVAYARSLAEQFDGGTVPRWQGANILPDGGGMPDFGPTSRGYTGTGQVRVSDDMTIDVVYEVVDLSSLIRASGDLQPRDRSKLNSDVWVMETAARFDPAQVMPSPNASTGAPIVGPDNVIESGNGRVMVIGRTYEYHPDRAAMYRQKIEDLGFDIPEGVKQPVLIARRKTEMSREQLVEMVAKAQDSGVAQLSATEKARMGANGLNPTRMALYRPDLDIRDVANKPFVKSFLESLSASVRMVASDAAEGVLSSDGRRLLREAMFARAWPDIDLIEMMTEGDFGDLKSLMDALMDVAPHWAGLRADIAAGKIDEAFDITGYVLDAMRMIAEVRGNARRAGQKLGPAMQDFLDSPDMLDGAIAPLTHALLRKFWSKGQPASADKVSDFLGRYVSEARSISEGGGGMFDAPSPADVLRAIDPDIFGALTDDFGPVRGFARAGDDITARLADLPPAPTMLDDGFNEGAASAEAVEVDAQIRGEIEAEASPNDGISELRQIITAGASKDEIYAHPAVQRAVAAMEEIEPTTNLPQYGTNAFWETREYSASGQKLVGRDAAVDYLHNAASKLAWTDEGLPPGVIRSDRSAVIILGPPAAGKSTVANPIARDNGAVIVDADEAKKIIPEYARGIGASAVHEESSELNEAVLFDAMAAGNNLVLQKVGAKESSIAILISNLRKSGYTVEVVLVDVPAEEAHRRMIGRFVSTGRIIPPHVLDEGIIGAPRTYAALKEKGLADGYAKIDNTAPIGQPRTILENTRETVSVANLGRDGDNRRASGGELRGTDGTRAGQGGGADEGLVDLTPQRAADDLAAARVDLAENAGLGDDVRFADLPFKMEDGTTANARDFLDDLDADAEADAVLQICRAGGTL